MSQGVQLDDEANSEIADGYATGSSARRGVAVGDLPASSVSAPQLVLQTLGSAPTLPLDLFLFQIELSINVLVWDDTFISRACS